MAEITFPCDKAQIEAILPHRDPFVWVSRVIECEPGVSITAELDIDPDLPLFAGHFPTHPVFPGVLIMEALAQTASICVLTSLGAEGRVGFFTGIDNAKFRHQVLPGDTLVLTAQIVKSNKRMAVAEVKAMVNGEVAATATQKYVLAKADEI